MGLLVEVSIPEQLRQQHDAVVDEELNELAMRREYDAVLDANNETTAQEITTYRDTLLNVRSWVAARNAQTLDFLTLPTVDEVIGEIDGVLARYGG
jgi:hypothetical protein